MSDERELWIIVDARNGERASITSYNTREQAARKIAEWRARDARGGRPDMHEYMPHLEPRRHIWTSGEDRIAVLGDGRPHHPDSPPTRMA
jgi:hypothetical protein